MFGLPTSSSNWMASQKSGTFSGFLKYSGYSSFVLSFFGGGWSGWSGAGLSGAGLSWAGAAASAVRRTTAARPTRVMM